MCSSNWTWSTSSNAWVAYKTRNVFTVKSYKHTTSASAFHFVIASSISYVEWSFSRCFHIQQSWELPLRETLCSPICPLFLLCVRSPRCCCSCRCFELRTTLPTILHIHIASLKTTSLLTLPDDRSYLGLLLLKHFLPFFLFMLLFVVCWVSIAMWNKEKWLIILTSKRFASCHPVETCLLDSGDS